MSRSRRRWAWILLGMVLLAAITGRLLVGSTAFGLPDGDNAWFVMSERVERMCLALIVGVALAVSGVALQALLRNPLAEPYILGLSTGAGLGILVQGYLTMQLSTLVLPPGLGAVAGTILTLAIVFFASRRRGVVDRLGLLLVGVVLSTINGAVILLLNHLVGPGGIRENLMNWMMGLLPVRELGSEDAIAAGLTLAVSALLWWQGRAMDVATLDDDEAGALGIHVGRLKTLLLLSASVLTATAVLIAGPIAFVGLIAPHIGRVLLGPSHRGLLIAAAALGASLLLLADTASEGVAYVAPRIGRAPVGVFTAMIGGPAFLWLLRPQLGRGIE